MELTYEQLKARVAELELKQADKNHSSFKVTEKGFAENTASISFYGAQRFPVTLTKKGWLRLAAAIKSGELDKVIASNDAHLFQGNKKETSAKA
jgi:uncharacterized lipoprotein NlpE involved in copper resistance